MTRLPPRDGEWIDRSSPIGFRFEGRVYEGYQGDVVTSALWANGVRMVGRSFKYHRPRGTYSLAGHDVNAMFEDEQRTNLRGDTLLLTDGMNLRSVNTVGGLAKDRLRMMRFGAAFMPVGFYYKAFHTPKWLFPFYERQMRKVAGLGTINRRATATPTPKDYAFHDLLVIGGGPSGLAGAIAAAEEGVRVILVDEQSRLGGSLAWQSANDLALQSKLCELVDRVITHENIEIRYNTQVAGCYSDHWYALVDDRRLTKLRTRALLVASGCFEQPAVFQNNDLPGIMLGSAAQRLMHLYAVKPFDKCVVLAANGDGYRLTLDLLAAGVQVAAVVDLRRNGEKTQLGQQVADAGITIYKHHTVFEAIPGKRNATVEGAVVCPLDSNGFPDTAAKRRLDCDGVAVSVGWMPVSGPLYQAGGRFHYAQHVEQLVPKSLPAGVFAAGRVNGVFETEDRVADGFAAGFAAAEYLGISEKQLVDRPVHGAAPPSHPYPIYDHKGKKNFVEFDEDLHVSDFVNAHKEGYDNIELLKRYTTVGMGPSQGKLANMNAVRILARLTDKSINDTGTTTSRPFHNPVPIGHLAGRRFHPVRRTPMHAWHVQEDADFVHVGAWLRPEYYRQKNKSCEDLILEEACHVREKVGLIDLGTLGKIQVSGYDAVELLERIYTGSFASQKIGTMRYGLACDETGVIADDGIVARLAEDRFYITASSGGSAAFFRELQRSAILWKLRVKLANLTGQYTAMNVAGPASRDVISQWTDIDLSRESFGFGGVREGSVFGVPAILARVGFVGELGYEIHVPASYGLSVWQELMANGASMEIRPFGIEAQRLLRLEMGHAIVGIDTDALTNPFEANLESLVRHDKPFFVGQRSLEIIKKQPLTRRLAGFTFPHGYDGPLPEVCQLIVKDGKLAGRVTSIAHCSTIGSAIGLAFVRPDLAHAGASIQIRTDSGTLVQAEIVSLPFYDPENMRR